MLIVIIAALLGIWRYRTADYFKWVAILFVWMFAAATLFWGGGTLEDPTGDGLITRQIRQATGDGPEMGIFAIVFLVLYWGSIIFFITRLVKAAREAKAAEEASYDDPDFVEGPDNTSRKVAETLILIAFAAIWIWFFYIRPPQVPSEPQSSSTTETPQPLTLEQQVMGAAAEVNATTPQRFNNMILERATASGRTLTYHYRVEAEATPEEIRSFIRREVLPKVCSSSDQRRDLKNGVSYAYSYTTKGNGDATSMAISEQTCAQIED